ncbi:hypothetical protein F2Q68_00008588 [Brassica cretica]|uniref:Uncharacterized protein n=1 Tax=Brassica cretica TaxID=69181 RepID=A0A8S9KX18_BRACR|nr:hypothetical protein F2Q68_00008588 [Brassica cretica]
MERECPRIPSWRTGRRRGGKTIESRRRRRCSPFEEDKPDEVGNRDVAATEDPVGPSALGAPEEVGQDSAP